jgi:hypothetical protein
VKVDRRSLKVSWFFRRRLAEKDASDNGRHFLAIHFAVDALNGSFFDKPVT